MYVYIYNYIYTYYIIYIYHYTLLISGVGLARLDMTLRIHQSRIELGRKWQWHQLVTSTILIYFALYLNTWWRPLKWSFARLPPTPEAITNFGHEWFSPPNFLSHSSPCLKIIVPFGPDFSGISDILAPFLCLETGTEAHSFHIQKSSDIDPASAGDDPLDKKMLEPGRKWAPAVTRRQPKPGQKNQSLSSPCNAETNSCATPPISPFWYRLSKPSPGPNGRNSESYFLCVCHEAAIYSDSLFQFYVQMVNWLVVSTHLRNVSQLGSFIPNIPKKIKNVPNHQPVIYYKHSKHSTCEKSGRAKWSTFHSAWDSSPSPATVRLSGENDYSGWGLLLESNMG